MSDAIRLSDRLEAVIRLCPQCDTLADIGCDHGYISITAIERHIATRAIACDINEGPLSKAREHIEAFELSDRIDARLTNGLAAVAPGEADCIVITGMGGRLITEIIEEGAETAKAARNLVLGPQSEVGELRRYLMESGYIIRDEDMVEEDGKYYPLIVAGYDREGIMKPTYSEREIEYGPILIAKKHPVLQRYLINLKQVFQRNLESIERAKAAPDRAADIRNQADMIDKLIKEMS